MPVKIFLAPIEMKGRGILIDNKNSRLQADFTAFQFTDKVEEGDFIALPKSIARVNDVREAIAQGRALAEQYKKKLLVFFYGDHSYKEHIPGVITFKWSAHGQDKLPTEVITPVFSLDLAKERDIVWRHKSEKPSVSFCGFAGLPSVKTALRYHVSNIWLNVLSVATMNPEVRAQKRGLYFRRKGMRILQGDSRIDTHFVVRSAYFNQVEAQPEQLRQEYLDNMQNADFVLAPRGDANISTRFFEALSFGRIPVLIDTDCVLPLEKNIDYSTFIVRIPHTEMHTIPEKLLELYNSIADDEFIAMQQRARDTYERYLEIGPFFNFVFPLIKEKGPEAL